MTSSVPNAPIVAGKGEPGLVSVVIPSYNRAYIVGKAIESVLAQKYRPIEVIVVDDGSKDNTEEVVSRYGPEVRYFRQENAGVSAARNRGLREVRGEFVALLDSDDTWLDWKIPAQVAVLQANPEVGMVWTDMVAIDENGAVRNPRYLRKFYSAHSMVKLEDVTRRAGTVGELWKEAPGDVAQSPVYVGDIFQYMFLGNLVHTSTVLLRRERLQETGGFDTGLKLSGEDYDFHLRTTSHGPVAFLDASGILYRIGAEDQLTAPEYGIHVARNNLTTVLKCLNAGGDRIRLSRSLMRERLAESYAWLGDQELHLGMQKDAFVHLWRSFGYKPEPQIAYRACLALLPRSAFLTMRDFKRRLSARSV